MPREDVWPSHGRWNCSTSPPTFTYTRRDGGSHVMTGNSSSIVEAYLKHRPWVIMLGDSTVRIMYHKLLGLLTAPQLWGEYDWPVIHTGGVRNGHGPNGTCTGHAEAHSSSQWQPPEVWSNRTDVQPCVQEAFVRGVRLTSAWSAWGEQLEIRPLLSAARAGRSQWHLVGAPSAVVVSVGAWLSLSDNVARMLAWSRCRRSRGGLESSPIACSDRMLMRPSSPANGRSPIACSDRMLMRPSSPANDRSRSGGERRAHDHKNGYEVAI